jgi:hypothetical protein
LTDLFPQDSSTADLAKAQLPAPPEPSAACNRRLQRR